NIYLLIARKCILFMVNLNVGIDQNPLQESKTTTGGYALLILKKSPQNTAGSTKSGVEICLSSTLIMYMSITLIRMLLTTNLLLNLNPQFIRYENYKRVLSEPHPKGQT